MDSHSNTVKSELVHTFYILPLLCSILGHQRTYKRFRLPNTVGSTVAKVIKPMHVNCCNIAELTLVARTPRLISIIAGDPQYSLFYGRAVDVFNWAGRLEVLFDGLVHHQVLELSELRADVRKPSGAHVGRLAHPAGKREQGVAVLQDKVRTLGKNKGKRTYKVGYGYDLMIELSLAKTEKSVVYVPTRPVLRAPAAPLIILHWPCARWTTV